ncbi:TRAP transporter large permease subunit [Xanthobacteraceae bacterium Astr-EGSB]|uniref:TRAP transporter large permease n=1 Tax=Astrobacterium formosum TaxID=3069710 RepID=UPI0027AFDD04|nr:TRAP transporter large permease subunit [Xanthobacteraceae bacterium Astr-EGSB]
MVLVLFLGGLAVLILAGVPVSFALLGSALLMMWWLDVLDPQILADAMYNGADSYPLMAIPFFILAGELMVAGGLTTRIVSLMTSMLGHIRGGLGYAAIVASVIMASLSGSAVADTAAIGSVLLPMMRNAGYDVPRSAGLIGTGGIIAPIIPPSIAFIVFGITANVSILDLFFAGIAPGLMMGITLMAIWAVLVRSDVTKVYPWAGWKAIRESLFSGFWALLMPLIIIGGLKAAIFTPTEASATAVAYALFVGAVVYRELTVEKFLKACREAAFTSASVMFLVATASASAWLVTTSQVPLVLAGFLEPIIGSPRILVLVIVILVLIVGCVMDFTPNVLILTPVLMPVVRMAGIDPVYFGVVFILANCVGLLTPPVGVVLNVICGIGKIPMGVGAKGALPFILGMAFLLALFIAIPDLILVPFRWIVRL